MLLVRHAYGMLEGKFLIPGGVVEDDVLPMECVVREVAEEAGTICEVKGLICVHSGRKVGGRRFIAAMFRESRRMVQPGRLGNGERFAVCARQPEYAG